MSCSAATSDKGFNEACTEAGLGLFESISFDIECVTETFLTLNFANDSLGDYRSNGLGALWGLAEYQRFKIVPAKYHASIFSSMVHVAVMGAFATNAWYDPYNI